MTEPATITDLGRAALLEPDPGRKARRTLAATAHFFRDGLPIGTSGAPDRPARPQKPVLLMPRDMPKRNVATIRGRIALLHALAHIELNAIDLAWDLICRFGGAEHTLPLDFHRDWLSVAAEEAKHFLLLARRLQSLGAAYGDLPAHDGLWAAAARTSDDLLARLAIVPLVHEARGLDVTPGLILRLRQANDPRSARILELIARDEIKHVRAGWVWFERVAQARAETPHEAFRQLVSRCHGAPPRPPFNEAARRAAGLTEAFYRF